MFLLLNIRVEREGAGTLEEEMRKLLSHVKPDWKLENILIKNATGGFANCNYIVHESDQSERRIFVRLLNPLLEYYLRNHQRDYQFYHDMGLTVPILCIFGNGVCLEYLEADSLMWATADMKIAKKLLEPEVRRAVAVEIAEYHSEKIVKAASEAGFLPGIGWHDPEWLRRLWEGIDFSPSATSSHAELPTYERLLSELNMLTQRLDSRKSPVVFCHGDPNPSNLMYIQSTKTAKLVDYDSACVTHAVFDLGLYFMLIYDPYNPSGESPSVEYRRTWIHDYLTHKFKLDARGDVTESDVDKVLDDLKLGELKVLLHMMTCFGGMATWMYKPGMDKAFLLRSACDHWKVYRERKKELFGSD